MAAQYPQPATGSPESKYFLKARSAPAQQSQKPEQEPVTFASRILTRSQSRESIHKMPYPADLETARALKKQTEEKYEKKQESQARKSITRSRTYGTPEWKTNLRLWERTIFDIRANDTRQFIFTGGAPKNVIYNTNEDHDHEIVRNDQDGAQLIRCFSDSYTLCEFASQPQGLTLDKLNTKAGKKYQSLRQQLTKHADFVSSHKWFLAPEVVSPFSDKVSAELILEMQTKREEAYWALLLAYAHHEYDLKVKATFDLFNLEEKLSESTTASPVIEASTEEMEPVIVTVLMDSRSMSTGFFRQISSQSTASQYSETGLAPFPPVINVDDDAQSDAGASTDSSDSSDSASSSDSLSSDYKPRPDPVYVEPIQTTIDAIETLSPYPAQYKAFKSCVRKLCAQPACPLEDRTQDFEIEDNPNRGTDYQNFLAWLVKLDMDTRRRILENINGQSTDTEQSDT
ncbi:hypothetical protein [Sansalvadorimonas verongulae]|uniref:hypothetical protein n=1 Tax=Sansalvadorimonas verongulae TaxID=2172824 RepID=UPI0012BC1165|nr:hypothetical protein [Sansalvadorimonas verongulae]MTI13713.1 hypothetical protein [Sansalvadorimonas verongulae]